jgi:hypothetical protein
MIDSSRNGYGRETRKESNEGAALRIGPYYGCWGDFLTLSQQPISQTPGSEVQQWAHTWSGQNIGIHTGLRSSQSIVHLYFSKSMKLVLLTMKSILPISGIL